MPYRCDNGSAERVFAVSETHVTASEALGVLPSEWRARLAESELVPVTSGMSGAHVFRVRSGQAGDRYLKIGIGTVADQLQRECARTQWLALAGIRVPEIVSQFNGTDSFAMVMRALDGRPADLIEPDASRQMVTAIARAVRELHALPTSTCPFDETLSIRLARAREHIRRGEIDADHFDARNAGVTPAALYRRLEAAIPQPEDCVVTHGDATLSNLIYGYDGEIGFIDCGNCGKADRYVDLAQLLGEFADRFAPQARQSFLEAYGGHRWDARKGAFYADLYELF
jgi:aminoglycoside phosphotransferase